jgi:DUF4097 and DUF4098 domain-containing protein YvlB
VKNVKLFERLASFSKEKRSSGRALFHYCSTNLYHQLTMKLTSFLLLLTSCTALAATEEQINKTFNVAPGGTLVVDVDFGSIDVSTNATNDVAVDVWRKVTRRDNEDEEQFLRENPVHFQSDGNTLTIRSRSSEKHRWFSGWGNRNEAKYTLRVPAQFNVRLNTAGGGIAVSDVTGEVKADTSGGGLHFTRVHGPLNGDTSGGGIEVIGGGGSLNGDTSGGPIKVKDFRGNARVETSGGGITFENVVGEIQGETSGGGVSAVLPGPLLHPVNLSTSGGGVTVRVPENAAFVLDAETSGGRVSSELPVTTVGKMEHGHLKGTVNGGGVSVRLHSSGGGIHVKKL